MRKRSATTPNNEFRFFNDQKQLENKMKEQKEREDYHRSRLDYFPFISGELLE